MTAPQQHKRRFRPSLPRGDPNLATPPPVHSAMEPFRLVCRDSRGEWYMHDAQADSALAAFESAATGHAPYIVVPVRLGRSAENAIVQRWRQGATELGDCIHCGYDLKGIIRNTHGLAICPECGVGTVMKPLASPAIDPIEFVPSFKPGLMLERCGIIFSILGFFFFPLAFVGIVMGAFAHEFSRGVRGAWAIRAGIVSLVIGFLLFVTGVLPY